MREKVKVLARSPKKKSAPNNNASSPVPGDSSGTSPQPSPPRKRNPQNTPPPKGQARKAQPLQAKRVATSVANPQDMAAPEEEGLSQWQEAEPEGFHDVEASADEASTASTVEHGPYTNDQNREFERIFAEWKKTGDAELRERMILMHRPLVAYVARRFLDRGEQFEDIVQQGIIALIHALDQFDPERGVRFATFATPTIVGELRRYFRDKSWSMRVPRRIQELLPLINLKIEALTQELNRSPTYAEIARSLNLDIEEVAEILELPHRIEPLSLDEPMPAEPGHMGTVADQVGGNDVAIEEWVEYIALKTALEKLPEKQRQVLELAYFQGYSQTEIARVMKVSQMHISRLQRRALNQLRELMES